MGVRSSASTAYLRRTANLPGSTAYTIAGWMVKRAAGTGWENALALESASAWNILFWTTPNVRIQSNSGEGDFGWAATSGTWYYVAMASNGTSYNSLTGWVIEASGTVHTAYCTGSSFTATQLSIFNESIINEYFNGSAALMKVWSVKLTQAELLTQMFNPRVCVQEANCVLDSFLYSVDDVLDYSGLGRDWTKGGSPTTDEMPPVGVESATWVVRGRFPAAGGVVVEPAAISAATAVVAPTVVLGSLSITPAAISAAGTVVAPTVVLGSLSITPAVVSAATAIIAPTVVLGSVTIAPSPASAASAVVDPTVALGSTTAEPSPASATTSVIAPTVILGSLTISPTVVSAATSIVDPTVEIGGLTITPDPATAASSVIAPTVVLGSIQISPAEASAAGTVISPTVVLGSLSIAPAVVSAGTTVVDPTVVISAGPIEPAPVSARARAIDPDVVITGPAEIVHYNKRSVASQSYSTDTTEQEITAYTISWSDLVAAGFKAGDDVLVLYTMQVGGGGANVVFEHRVKKGSSFAGATNQAEGYVEPVGTAAEMGHMFVWMDRQTLVSGENWYVGFRTPSAGTAVRAEEFSALFLKLTGLTSNDFAYAEQTHAGDAPTSYDTSGAAITIPQAGDWLILAATEWLVDDVTADMFTAIYDGSSDSDELVTEGEDVAEQRFTGTMSYRASLAASTVMRVRYRTDEATTQDCVRTAIFGLRLNLFTSHAGQETTNTITHSALDTYQEFAGFGTYGATETGNHLVFAQAIHTFNESTKRPYARIQIDSADWPESGFGRASPRDNGAAAKMGPFMVASASISSGSRDIDFDCAEDADVTPNYSCTAQTAVVFSARLGSLVVIPSAATAKATAGDPTVLIETPGIVVTPNPVSAAATVIAPTVVLSSTTATPAAVTAAATVIVPTVILGSLTLTPAEASAATAVVDPAVIQGSITFTPVAISAVAVTIAPTVVLSSMTVTPAAITAAVDVIAPTVILGSLSLSPSPAAVVCAAIDPTVLGGGIAVTPAAIYATATVIDPTVHQTSTVAEPSPATAVGAAVDPICIGGGITVEPAAVSAIAASIAPTVVLGSTTATPTPAFAVATTISPTVVLGSLSLTPAALTASGSAIAPTVVLGSLSISPTPAWALTTTVDPTIILGSVSVTPAPTWAATTVVAPTVVIAGITLGIIELDLRARSFDLELEERSFILELRYRWPFELVLMARDLALELRTRLFSVDPKERS